MRATARFEREKPRSQTRTQRQALSVCLIAGFMTLLDVSIVNVALPSMQHGLQASGAQLSWIVSGYALTFGLILVPAGRLGDDRGRSRMFLIGLAAFTGASVLAGFAQNATWLVVARLLQGLAGGLLNPQVLGVIQQQFHGVQRGKALGLYGAAIGISTAIGPLLGGLIIELAGTDEGWRWVFFVNVPIGIAAILLGARVLPHNVTSPQHRSLDLVGVLLFGSGVACLLFPLVQAEGGAGMTWSSLLVSVVLLLVFVLWERNYAGRGHAPLVNFRLLSNASYSFGASLALLYFAGFTGIFMVLAVFFQRGLGYSPLAAGLALTPFAVGSAVAAVLGGRVVHQFGRRLVLMGLVMVVLGLVVTDVVLAYADGSHDGLLVAPPLLVAGAGSGLVISPNQTVTLSKVDTLQGGTAAGMQQTAQRVGSAIGISAASGVFFSHISDGDGYHGAITAGLWVAVAFVLAALSVGLIEMIIGRRRSSCE